MRIEAWDSEIRSLAIEIKDRRDHQAIEGDQQHGLLDLRAVVLQRQFVLQRCLERLAKLACRNNYSSPRIKTLMYWGGVYGERVGQYYENQIGVIGKAMWLQLIRTRLTGNQAQSMMVDDTDLLDMALRQSNLVKTERFLQHQLVEQKETKNRLHKRYRSISVEQANHEASKCMQANFGSSWQKAQRHPTLIRISKAFMRLTWPTRLSSQDLKDLQQLEGDINNQTNGLLGRCRSLIVESMGNSQAYVGSKTKERFRQSLLHIEELHETLSQRTATLAGKIPQPLYPKVMKKSLIHGRKSSLEK